MQRLEFYSPEELTRIVRRSAGILGIACEPEGAAEIARRSRGTPRIANRLLRRVRDFAQVKGDGVITRAIADAAMAMLKVDPEGFDQLDRRMLSTIIELRWRPVGISRWRGAERRARHAGRRDRAVSDPAGLSGAHRRGRIASAKAYQHLGLVAKPSAGRGWGDGSTF